MDPKTFTYDVARCYVNDHVDDLNEGEAVRIIGYIRARDFKSLASLTSLLPDAYATRQRCSTLRQIEALFKKNAYFTDDRAATDAALQSFARAERICRITNRRLDWYFTHRGRIDPDVRKVLAKSEGLIARLLGEHRAFLDQLPEMLRVTSGATSHRTRRQSAAPLKIYKELRCSTRAVPYLNAMKKYYGFEGAPRVRADDACRVEFVPKNWKTKRTIACEPDWNIPFQLAFDTYVKRALLKIGVDLLDQSKNQEFARLGSLGAGYCTLDLSMASDTLSLNTVRWLMPESWWSFLSAFRSSRARLPDGSYARLAKFSSMGNGMTFGLETLVFASVLFAVCGKDFACYGDDLAFREEHLPLVVKTLKFLGFVPNLDKSFSGPVPFRESCGADWYLGQRITPFYVREVAERGARLCHNINGLVGIAGPSLGTFLADIVRDERLKLVPFNGVSDSGVWITPHAAYHRKLIRSTGSIPWYRQYIRRSPKQMPVKTLQGYYLFFIERNSILRRDVEPEGGKYIDLLRSKSADHGRYAFPIDGYRWGRINWREPIAFVPTYLYWWDGLVTP